MFAQTRFSLLFLLLLSLGLFACGPAASDDDDSASDDDDAASDDDDDDMAMTVVDIAVEDGRFTTLVAALQATGLDEVLMADGPYTVFAPTDDAFALLPAGTVDSLLEDLDTLSDILLYHVVAGSVDAATVSGLVTATTVLGAPVNIDATAGVEVGRAGVTQADIVASNGIIHVIDAVLLPPPTIAEVAEEAGFTTLLTAATAAGLAGALSDPDADPITVFAPTDAAFAALPAGALDDLLADTTALTDVLTYHLVDGIVDSQAVVGLDSAGTLNGEMVTIDASSGVVLNGDVNVTATDIVARNGIIHVIDGVLLPSN